MGSTLSFGGQRVGEGRLAFDYAVLGASSGTCYAKINGIRSEVEGLGTWIGLRSLEAEHKVNNENRIESVNLRLQSSPPIRVARRLNAEFQSNWRYGPGPGPDQTTISERMQLQTQLRDPKEWDVHFGVHFSVRNLLRIAAWRRLDFAAHDVMSVADPIRTRDGTAHGNRWLPLVTHQTGINSEAPETLRSFDFLFAYRDVGSTGVRRWINLSQEFDRGLSPLMGLLELEGASLEAHLAQFGIGFEMLGYDLLRASGVTKTQADKKNWEGRVRAVTSVTASVLPFEEDHFVDLLRRNYSAVKHADNARPDRSEMHLACRQAVQVFRSWVAIRLGMSKRKLRVALDDDAVTSHIREIERVIARERKQSGRSA